MKKFIQHIAIALSITLLLPTIFFVDISLAANKTNENYEKTSKLEQQVSKGYSNKFCNAIGMGVSPQGAMKLTIDENSKPSFNPSLWFELVVSGEDNIRELNDKNIAEMASDQIIDICGGAMMLSNKDDEIKFKSDFLNQVIKNKVSTKE